MKIRYTRRALSQLDEIYGYIAKENPDAAAGVISSIQSAINNLAYFPRLGRATDRPDVYRLVQARFQYRIFYRLRGDEVIILRVLHGAQLD
jgi:toxin ParE1/3/4